MKFLKAKQVKAIVESFDDGTMFSVVFQKKDSTLRRMVCRTGVTQHLAGGEATYNKSDPDNFGVYDVEAQGYRCFNINRVLRIKGGGATVEACDVGDIEQPIHNAAGEAVAVK